MGRRGAEIADIVEAPHDALGAALATQLQLSDVDVLPEPRSWLLSGAGLGEPKASNTSCHGARRSTSGIVIVWLCRTAE